VSKACGPQWGVLVVEGDRDLANLLHQVVTETHGFRVLAIAQTTAEAAQLVRNLRPHLMLLDIGSPGGGGLALLRRLRAASLPAEVIVLSGVASVDVIRAALHSGVVDYLIKPVEVERLRRSLSQFSDRMSVLARGELGQTDVDTLRLTGAPTKRWIPKDLRADRVGAITRILDMAREPMTADEVGKRAAVSRVTARRYLEYLVSIRRADVSSLPDGPGRPRKTYFGMGRLHPINVDHLDRSIG
jgi:response regulator of citrate/malate metabolism